MTNSSASPPCMSSTGLSSKVENVTPACAADDLHDILVVVGGEAPEPRAPRSRRERQRCRDDVLGGVEAALIGGATLGLDNRAEDVVEQIQRMGREVDEQSAAGDLRIDAPRQRAGRRHVPSTQANRHRADVSDRAGVHQRLHLHEPRQHAPVVRGEQRHARLRGMPRSSRGTPRGCAPSAFRRRPACRGAPRDARHRDARQAVWPRRPRPPRDRAPAPPHPRTSAARRGGARSPRPGARCAASRRRARIPLPWRRRGRS